METVLTLQIEELTRLQEEEHQQLLVLLRENDQLLTLVKEYEEELDGLRRKKRMLSFDNLTLQNTIDKLEEEISSLNQQINSDTNYTLNVQKRADYLHDQCKLFESLKEEETKQYKKHLQEVTDYFTNETVEGQKLKSIQKQIKDLQGKIQEQQVLIQREEKKHQIIHAEIQTVSTNMKREEKKKQDYFKQQQQKEQKEKQIRSQIDYHQTSMSEKMQERDELELALSQMQDELQTLTSETNSQIQKRDAFCKRLKQLDNEDFY